MKTPLRRGLDDEIFEVEARISRRREELPRVARDTGRRAVDGLVSPVGLAAAVAIGFLAGGGVRRRRAKPAKQKEKEKPGFAIGSLLMTGALALLRAQLGSPAQMAQLVLSKIPAQKGARRPATTAGPQPISR